MKLYFTPGACSLAPHIILEELAITHTLEQVDLKTKTTINGIDYLSINEKGYVPALELDNGHILTEGSVISQYLADLKPDLNLIPVNGEARYQLQSLMVFISTELHKPMGSLFNPKQSHDWKEASTTILSKRLNWLKERLEAQSFLTGEQFTIADAYLFTVLNWAKLVDFDLTPWPVLISYLERIAKRPAVQQALKVEGLI
ncbi:MAG: Glutathione S-transferase GST-6.0 [Candidatus Celerinatantimonas neptuna]|nr:MAG: Glutathione S-transferase GST-6.0 [Candidatus Celerinatantimonas neptuna]